jgi:hypothetical protein
MLSIKHSKEPLGKGLPACPAYRQAGGRQGSTSNRLFHATSGEALRWPNPNTPFMESIVYGKSLHTEGDLVLGE